MAPDYECSVCKVAVLVTPNGVILRGCKHDAPVIANLRATTEMAAMSRTEKGKK